jgi:hypothetical protein
MKVSGVSFEVRVDLLRTILLSGFSTPDINEQKVKLLQFRLNWSEYFLGKEICYT